MFAFLIFYLLIRTLKFQLSLHFGEQLTEYVAVEKRLLKEILNEIGELKKLVNESFPQSPEKTTKKR
jgi:hypothetical protein